jgi:hypothetical protein
MFFETLTQVIKVVTPHLSHYTITQYTSLYYFIVISFFKGQIKQY